MRSRLSVLAAALLSAGPANAAQPAELAPDARIDVSAAPPEGRASEPETTLPAPPAEAPPPRPRHRGLVLEQSVGAIGFGGEFRHVAPPGFWLHTQLGYEPLRWLMVFGEGELAFTDTSESQDESHVMAFPIWGFGAGARVTLHATERVAFFAQGDAGGLQAIVPHGSLALLGYPGAESLSLAFGGRLGVEWYQIDRHLALVAQGGAREAQGFKTTLAGTADVPLAWDAAGGLRYTF